MNEKKSREVSRKEQNRQDRQSRYWAYSKRAITATVLVSPLLLTTTWASGAEDRKPLMETVVVTATRQAENIASVPANITVISGQQIDQSSAETVPELLRTVEGVVISDITGNGRNFTVDLRGFGETATVNTLVLIDGRRINQVDLSGTDWSLIPLDQVERIEIVRGSRGGVLYGDNAAGGTINIITKKGKDALFSAGLATGSYGTLHSNAEVSGSSDRFSYALSANFQESDGYRDNSDTNAKNVGATVEHFASDKFSVTVSGGYHEDDTSLPGAITHTDFTNGVDRTASLHPDDSSKTTDYYVQVTPQFYLTDSSYIKLDASSRNRDASSFVSFSSGSSLYEAEIDTLALSPQFVFKNQLLGHASNLTIGYDYNESQWDASNEAVFFSFPSKLSAEMTKTTTGYYLHEEFSVTDKLLLSGGARHDKATYEFPDSASIADSIMEEDLYTTGVSYRFTNEFSTFVSYSKSFRNPLLDELFNMFTNTFNGTLTSQTGDDIEVGLLFQTSGDMTLGLTVFRTKTENEIFYNASTFENTNLDGDAIRQGVEMKVGKEFEKVKLSGSYTYRDTNIDGGQYDGKEVPNVPKNQFTIGADTSPCTNVHVSLNGSYIGERMFISDFANTHSKQEDYFYLTSKISYTLPKGSIYLVMNNLLNEDYSEYGAIEWTNDEGFYPSPDFNFLVGANLEF